MDTNYPFRQAVSGLRLILALFLFTSSSVSAKGQFDKITIQESGTGRQIEIGNPALLGFFAFSDFDNGTLQAPQVAGPGYEVTRWAISQEDGKTYVPVDRLHYYHTSDSNTLKHGWILYEGLINGSSEYDNHWFTSTRNADALVEGIILSSSILPASESSTQASNSSNDIWAFMGIGAAALIALIATKWFLRQKKHTI